MIHLRDRAGAVGHRACGLTDLLARAVSLSWPCWSIMRLPLRKSRHCRASYLEVASRTSDGAAERRGNTLAAGRGPRKGLRTEGEEERPRSEDGGFTSKVKSQKAKPPTGAEVQCRQESGVKPARHTSSEAMERGIRHGAGYRCSSRSGGCWSSRNRDWGECRRGTRSGCRWRTRSGCRCGSRNGGCCDMRTGCGSWRRCGTRRGLCSGSMSGG